MRADINDGPEPSANLQKSQYDPCPNETSARAMGAGPNWEADFLDLLSLADVNLGRLHPRATRDLSKRAWNSGRLCDLRSWWSRRVGCYIEGPSLAATRV